MVWYIISLFFGGLIIGAIARLIVPGRQNMGCFATSLCGIGGAIIGGFVGRLVWGDSYVPGFLISLAGAVLLVWLLYGTRRRTY